MTPAPQAGRSLGIQARLSILILVAVLPLVALSSFAIFRAVDDERARLEGEVRGRAEQLLADLDRQISGIQASLQLLATSPALQSDDLGGFYRQLREAVNIQGLSMVLADRSGKQLVNSSRELGNDLPYLTDQAALQRVFATGMPQVSDLVVGKVTKRALVSVEAPVRRDGGVAYVLSMAVEPESFAATMREQKTPDDWTVGVFDRDGIIIARNTGIERFLGQPAAPALRERMRQDASGSITSAANEDNEVYTAFLRSPLTGWTVAASVPRAALDAPLRRTVWLTVGGGLAVLAVSLALAWWMGRTIRRPVDALTKAARALGAGETPHALPAGIRELDQVAEALSGAALALARRAAERDAAEAQLRASERRLQATYSHAPVGIGETDLDGHFQRVNQGLCELTGYRPDELTALGFLGVTYAADLPTDRALFERLKKGEIPRYALEKRFIHKRGHPVWVMVVSSLVRDEAGVPLYAIRIVQDLSARTAAEAALREANELLERRVAVRTRELGDSNLRLLAEIEERKRAEAQLVQAQKMEAVGQLTGGVAHDFNNLLTAILGNLELAEARAGDDAIRRLLGNATRAAERGAKLTEQLLAFSRKQHLQPKSIDLNRLIVGMNDMLARTIGALIRVETALAESLWPALVDANQIELAILNLAVNARDSMPLGGSLLIETSNVARGDPSLGSELAPGDYVLVAVTDTGSGMDEDILAKVFEPFFTTKEVGKGSGLGLSQVYGVARQSGGTVRIVSKPGEGTAVRIYVPRAAAGAFAAGVEPVDGMAKSSGVSSIILLVDDDPAVRSLAATCLRDCGHRVREASGGRAALAVLEGSEHFDLLISDFAMPGMNGIELAQAARLHRPALPILFMTGYAERLEGSDRLGNATLIKKPFRILDLAAAVERAVASTAAPPATNVIPWRTGL
jgi:PAS domain S-box-containing protein